MNTELVVLNWMLGKFISLQMQRSAWGEKTIEQLSSCIRREEPALRGFEKRSLERMRRFYETWSAVTGDESIRSLQAAGITSSSFASTLSTQLSAIEKQGDDFTSTVLTQIETEKELLGLLCRVGWSHHMEMLPGSISTEERLFYLGLTIRDGLTVRELRRQIESGLFERHVLSGKQLPLVNHPEARKIQQLFKDTYITEFLNLTEPYSERELQRALVTQMKQFILELGGDFLFAGEEFKLQVGYKDYFLDLLFYHRELHCLVVFELKIEEFKPEHLGKLNFYLEALDRDVRKKEENPSIGVLLCKTRDTEVVEYAMSRNMSPALVAEYRTKLPDKKTLQRKMHELMQQQPGKENKQ